MKGRSEGMEKYWDQAFLLARNVIVSVVVFIMGSTVRGEWLLFWIYYNKSIAEPSLDNTSLWTKNTSLLSLTLSEFWSPALGHLRLQGLGIYWLWATTVSFVIYLVSGGFLYWHYYVCQRESATEWKCQPTKFPSGETLRNEILTGSFSLLLGSSVTGIVACYVMNGGYCTIYYKVGDYGWLWYIVSIPFVFIWQDYLTYWVHRMFHQPFLYRHFHKVHHKYKQPTAFSATSFHPVELYTLQAILFSPMFLFPVHWTIFVGSLINNYYHGIIDHSGVNFKAQWWQPWQPDAIFHDNHHQYTFVNFGVNCKYWDVLHGTQRKKTKLR